MFLGYIITNKLFNLINLHKRSILHDYAVRIKNFIYITCICILYIRCIIIHVYLDCWFKHIYVIFIYLFIYLSIYLFLNQ